MRGHNHASTLSHAYLHIEPKVSLTAILSFQFQRTNDNKVLHPRHQQTVWQHMHQ